MTTTIRAALGVGSESAGLAAHQMALRALVVYLLVIVLVRLGERRFLSRRSAFDLVLAIVLGSVASRAITGNAPFLPSLAGAAALVLVHWVVAVLAWRSQRFGRLVKGRPIELVRQGEMLEKQMRRAHITPGDLDEAIRKSRLETLAEVEAAFLERSGEITVLACGDGPTAAEGEEADGPLARSPTGGRGAL